MILILFMEAVPVPAPPPVILTRCHRCLLLLLLLTSARPQPRALIGRAAVQWVIEVQPPPHGLSHLLRGHRRIVQLLQLGDVPDHGLPVQSIDQSEDSIQVT